MSTVLRLPNALAAPLTPRRANVGKLPKGIARFSKAKRERDAQAAAATRPLRAQALGVTGALQELGLAGAEAGAQVAGGADTRPPGRCEAHRTRQKAPRTPRTRWAPQR